MKGSWYELKAHAGACAGAVGGASASASLLAGVKASSSSAFNTFAAASSNQTKLYGNGQTAGQIAIQAGFGAAILFGPGNSQPHKVSCGAHLIDVHALKAHAGACAAAAGAAGVSGQVSASASGGAQVAAQAKTQAGVAAKSGGVLGASATTSGNRSPARGALGLATRSGTLPFTGLPLLAALVFGLALLAGGYGLRRLARPHA